MSPIFHEAFSAEVCGMGIRFDCLDRIMLRTERNIPMHLHMIYEMHVLLNGEAQIISNENSHLLKKGEIALIPPKVYHSISNVTPQFQLVSLSFQLYPISKPKCQEEFRFHQLLTLLQKQQIHLLGPQPEIIHIIQQIRMQNTSLLAETDLINTYVMQMLIYLFRAVSPSLEMPVRTRDTTAKSAKSIEMERQKVIESYIAERYADSSILELADMLAISEQHLRRFLRDHYSMSFSQLVNSHRINVSKHLLQNTDKTISEIAEQVGFHSFQNFSVTFKKYIGCSASEFRLNGR